MADTSCFAAEIRGIPPLRSLHASQNHEGTGTMKRIIEALGGWIRRASEAYRQAQLQREIAHLDERMLKDIGLWDGRR